MNLDTKDLEQYVFETPDLVDTTTAPTTTARSLSPGSIKDDVNDEGSASGLFSHPIQTDQSRRAFQSAQRRTGSPPRYYYAPSQSKHTPAANEFDFAEEVEEPTEARLLRLRKEIEEVKTQVEQQENQPLQQPDILAEVSALQTLLDSVNLSSRSQPTTGQAEAALSNRRNEYQQKGPTPRSSQEMNLPPVTAAHCRPAEPQPEAVPDRAERFHYALTKAAELDARLAQLEGLVGLKDGLLPEQLSSGPQPPVLTTLALLDKQIALLASSPQTLQQAHQQIQQLVTEAERLDHLQMRQASEKGLKNPFGGVASFQRDRFSTLPGSGLSFHNSGLEISTDNKALHEPESGGLDVAQIAKITALYDTLPTIKKLASTLPLMLERLRTLRLVHAAAGSASETITELENRLRDQKLEIKTWRNSLDCLERRLGEGEDVMKENVDEIGGWVRDLEGRIDGLKRLG